MVCVHCQKEFLHLHMKWMMEKLKNKIYKQIIERNLDVSIDDDVDFMVQEAMQVMQKKDFQTPPEIPLPKMPQQSLTNDIETLFDKLEDARNYSSILQQIQEKRNIYQSVLTPQEYVMKLNDHLVRLKEWSKQKNISEKKLTNQIYPKYFSALEARLLLLPNFYKQSLEPEDIHKFKMCQKNLKIVYEEFTPFSFPTLQTFFQTYALAFCNIKELFRKCIFQEKFPNVIYYSAKDEGYAFYTLEKVEKEKRFWKMDCRLEHLTVDLGELIVNVCIDLFRRLYKACFSTNDYIENYHTQYPVTEFDCEQLFENIIFASDFFTLNTCFCQEVKENCSYTGHGGFDKFDLLTEDREQAETFSKYRLEKEDNSKHILHRMFDNVDEQSLTFLLKRFL